LENSNNFWLLRLNHATTFLRYSELGQILKCGQGEGYLKNYLALYDLDDSRINNDQQNLNLET